MNTGRQECIGPPDRATLWDPQTSGGLLTAIDPMLAVLASDGTFWHIGEVTAQVKDEVHVLLEVH